MTPGEPGGEVYINRIATAVPPRQVHRAYCDWAAARIEDPRAAKLFTRMAGRAGISARQSVLPETSFEDGGFYAGESWPGTAARMRIYAERAPELAVEAVQGLGALEGITHLVVASCTGFVAPGVDQIIAERLGLGGKVRRVLIGFMGCYAAVPAMRTAAQIVAGDAAARVLVVAVELSTLHLQDDREVEPLLAQMLFADGAAAAIVSGEAAGLAVDGFFTRTLPDSAGLITWTIGDHGFVMHLSGEVPKRIEAAARDLPIAAGEDITWAVHPGGRSILDAVEQAFGLEPEALAISRAVLDAHGNMSSATVLFVLKEMMVQPKPGVALAFGPGMTAEGFRFRPA
ncbi:type III polyketide synthase [Sphingomonas sp. ID0503]|uniref:type III polyketide synthase n=1 Tax=Sphingomonas sp. ID0503 TaxID=3399691 RepID=UPI003AFA6F7D